MITITNHPYLLTVLTALAVTAFLIPLANTIGLVDYPDAKIKRHKKPVPLVGGLMIAMVVLIAFQLTLELPQYYNTIILCCTAAAILGAIDDYSPFHPLYRLLIQLIIGLYAATIVMELRLSTFGFPILGHEWGLGILAIPIAATGVSGLANAYNMCDGIDGLTAILVMVTLAAIYIVMTNHPETSTTGIPQLLLVVMICLTVFLFFNLQIGGLPKIFLGDGGSLMLGVFMALVLIDITQKPHAIIEPVTALWLVGVPLVDMVCTMVRRYKKGLAMWQGDRAHLHHILTIAGLSHKKALTFIAFISALMATIGVGLHSYFPQNNWLSFFLFLIYTYVHYSITVKNAWSIRKLIRRWSRTTK